MSEFLPKTEWVAVSQSVYDTTTVGSTTVHNKPVIEKGSNLSVCICKSFTKLDNCNNCTQVLSCPVGKLVFSKNNSIIKPSSYL